MEVIDVDKSIIAAKPAKQVAYIDTCSCHPHNKDHKSITQLCNSDFEKTQKHPILVFLLK